MGDLHIRYGAVAVRIHLFAAPGEEMSRTLHPPWPTWMRRLYEMESLADRTPSPQTDEGPPVTMGAAVRALAERLHHRLELAAFVVAALEEVGWQVVMDGDGIVASKVIVPAAALDELEDAGILGPMTKVCELDPGGLPRLHHRWEMG